ncbi:MAG TPA: SurA N-terminal domain-containing protein [Povalibacter sp.]|nr:SurA N-terminal domain-containing protein [Povalibacter sp.]
MLQTIRDKITGWFATVFLGAIALVFIFWGIDFKSNSANFAAKVDGTRIPTETVRRAWQQRQSQLQQMMRAELPPELVKSQQQQLLDEYVRNTLLRQRAEKLGYRVSDEALSDRITSIPQLQADGKFDRDRYAAALRQQGRTETQFEAELRADMAIGQIQEGVVDSAFVVPYELDRRFALEKQQRELDYVLIATNDFENQVTVTDAQIQAWFEAHKDNYMLPETVNLQFIELTRAQVESTVSVTEDELKDHYEQVKERFESPERRQARHILITIGDGVDDAAAQKKAQELAAQAKGGADFAELAKQNSKDPGSAAQGGDLGWAQRGMFVGPFEDALFSMSPGEIRGPIKTQFGYHVIQLQAVEAGKLRSFEDVRAELEADFRKERSQQSFYEQSQTLADRAFASLTELESVAKQLNLPLKTVTGFTREGGGDLGNDPGVIEAAFSNEVLEQGRNSPLVTIGEDRALVLRVIDHKPAEPRPLAEVRAQIEAQVRVQAAKDAAAAKGKEVLAKLQQGADWAAVVSEFGLKPAGRRYVVRDDRIVPPAVARAAFAVQPTGISESKPHFDSIATDDGNFAVFAISGIRHGDPTTEAAAERKGRERRTQQQSGNDEFAAYVTEAERKTKIVRNEKVFE